MSIAEETKENKLIKYLKDSKNELKKVAWPTKKETTKNTLLVIGVSLGVAFFLGACDYFFTYILEKVI